MARSRREIPRFQFWGSATTLPPSGPGCQRIPRHVWLLRGVQQTAARRVGADSSAAGSSGVCHTKSSYSDGSCCCSEPSNSQPKSGTAVFTKDAPTPIVAYGCSGMPTMMPTPGPLPRYLVRS